MKPLLASVGLLAGLVVGAAVAGALRNTVGLTDFGLAVLPISFAVFGYLAGVAAEGAAGAGGSAPADGDCRAAPIRPRDRRHRAW